MWRKLILVTATILFLVFSGIRLASSSPISQLRDIGQPMLSWQYPLFFTGAFLWTWGLADLRYWQIWLIVAFAATIAVYVIITGNVI
jgi:hypothetical protein